MGVIRRLSEEVASQVAAGEVVERPASIIKELVENSLDAGATRVDVEYQRGGSNFLAVTDDGRGMDRDDAVLCLERHATSKIRTGLDLESVVTYGFRGEALPSIASVSRFRLSTRPHGADAGTEVVVSGGKVECVRDCGEAAGTRIEVRNLFFNLPARKKFLRGDRTEAAHIDHQFQTLAMTYIDRRFSLRRDGRQVHLLAPSATLLDRVRDLLGLEFASGLFPLDVVEHDGIRVSGLLGRPGGGRGDRSAQTVFVNGRAVVSNVISQPLREAYGSALPRGMHPSAILFVAMDTAQVDCNVHPAKREVRFRDGMVVREAIYESVRGALEQFRSRFLAKPVESTSSAPSSAPREAPLSDAPTRTVISVEPDNNLRAGARDAGKQPVPVNTPDHFVPAVSVAPASPEYRPTRDAARADADAMELPGTVSRPDAFRFAGVVGDRYILLEENGSGLVLLDNRAARERIVFEQILRQMQSRQAGSQRLLLPAIVELSPKDFEWVRGNIEILATAGVLVEPFGSGTVKVDGVPPVLADLAVPELLLRIADDCRLGGRSGKSRAVEESIARAVARSASLAGRPDDATATHALLGELLACDLPYACPNGRPTMIHFSFAELDRKFGYVR